MASGTPDYAQQQANTFISSVSDMGELAARLGSPVTYQRTGNVQFYLRCTEGLSPWAFGQYGTGASVAEDTTISFRNDKSIKLIAGSDGAALARVAITVPVLTLSGLGFEVAFRPTTDPYQFRIRSFAYDGVNQQDAIAMIDMDANEIQYQDDAGNLVKLDDIPDLQTQTGLWHIFKMVVDFETGVYKRFYLDNDAWTFDAVSLKSTADATIKHINCLIGSLGGGGDNPQININDFIWTINEP